MIAHTGDGNRKSATAGFFFLRVETELSQHFGERTSFACKTVVRAARLANTVRE